MRIPRQADGGRATTSGVDGLRARRQDLISRLRTVAYWQRLAQGRTDLLVAGLLYGAPVPLVRRPLSVVAGSAAAEPVDDARPALPPEGLDVDLLLGGSATRCDPGSHLDRLRGAALLLTGHRIALEDELDAVTLALHDLLAVDGADERHHTPVQG